MNKISYVINAVLAVAVIVLFILFFTSKNSASSNSSPVVFQQNDSTALLPIAYVNLDSLLSKYNFALDANDKLMKKFNSSNNTVAQRRRQLENEHADFNRKVQQNAFITQERAQQEANRIQKLTEDFQQMAQRLENELAVEQQNMNAQVADSVRLFLKEYNKKANYQIIFNNMGLDNVLVAKEKYDITNEVVTMLNSRYTSETKK